MHQSLALLLMKNWGLDGGTGGKRGAYFPGKVFPGWKAHKYHAIHGKKKSSEKSSQRRQTERLNVTRNGPFLVLIMPVLCNVCISLCISINLGYSAFHFIDIKPPHLFLKFLVAMRNVQDHLRDTSPCPLNLDLVKQTTQEVTSLRTTLPQTAINV